ncbi:MAG: tetratricopeptide repeat protein [Planctomycetaceae bacterium]|jgi:tetratricopeptide (TPR) repeat protein|nr:tetratricopeptide repeat protein [Planctomycetaceae bacterium]
MFKVLRFWPGFTGLVRYGNWSFLAIAVAFGLAIDVILMLNFYWTEYITTSQRNVLVVAFLVLYATLAGISRQLIRHIEIVRNTDAKGDGFREAIQHYLRGNWFEAQCCLNILLKKNPHDAEALLMMATLLRHIKRYDEAAEVLDKLERIQESAAWRIELQIEKQALTRCLTEVK